MNIGYAMINNATDSIEEQVNYLKIFDCELIYKDILSNQDYQLVALRDLLENLQEGDEVIIKSINLIALNIESPLGLFDVLKEKKCSLRILDTYDSYTPEGLGYIIDIWKDLLPYHKLFLDKNKTSNVTRGKV